MSNPKFNAWQESKDLYGLTKLQQIADSQKQMAAAAGEQAKIAAEHAAAMLQIEQARLGIEQGRQHTERTKQEVRKRLFEIENDLRSLAAVEDQEPFESYMLLKGKLRILRKLPVSQVGELADMTAQSNLMAQVQQRHDALYERHSKTISTLTRVVSQFANMVMAAFDADSRWAANYLNKYRSLACDCETAITISDSKQQQLEKTIRESTSMGCSVTLAVMGGISILCALVMFGTIGDNTITNSQTGEALTTGDKLFASIALLVVSIAWLWGGLHWRKRAVAKKRMQLQIIESIKRRRGEAEANLPKHKAVVQTLPIDPCQNFLKSRGVPDEVPESLCSELEDPNTDLNFAAALTEMQETLRANPGIRTPSLPFLQTLATIDLTSAERLLRLMNRLRAECPFCKSLVGIKQEHGGKTVRCPKCSKPMTIDTMPIPDHETLREIKEIVNRDAAVGIV